LPDDDGPAMSTTRIRSRPAAMFVAIRARRDSCRASATSEISGKRPAAIASFNVPALVNLYRTGTPYDWRALAHFVRDNARTDDFILFVPAFARIPFEYYFEGPQKRMSVNPREVISANRQVRFKTQINVGKFAAVARGHPRMWIIATIPIGEEARKEIAKILAPYFREVEGKSFGLVYAFRWESRVYEGPPGP